ncbi:MAG: arylsulfatase [Phycisphaerales bacterium]|nr:arylsulfatase [Phycisphaerales bacterium]
MLIQSGLAMVAAACLLVPASAQESLPFPRTPSASKPGLTIQGSTHQKRVEPRRIAEDAPNILVVLIDDVGPATADTYGGEIATPNLSRVAGAGISFNRFHSTAMCSPTRSALLTGRNHTRVGNGQICELANDWDGFSGAIPMTSATFPEVLKNYGYNTAAWGKWHNTPAEETTSKGPFDRWPTGYGFEYFYGFLAGEASQYEPHLVRNTTIVDPRELHREDYHVTEDLADDAIRWLREQESFAPDKPFLMYFSTGAAHGPHHVPREWADKYKGKFDDGWDAYRVRAHARAKELGFIPQDAELTARPESLPSWDSIPEKEKPFQRRLMEVFAGFVEHTDHQVGRILDEIEAEGRLDNTIVIYIWGDNGSSAEGQRGTISELLAQNSIPTTIDDHLRTLEELGGLDALGSAKTDNMYHAGWAWAGSSPYKSTKLIGAHFGGTRQPMAVAWPAKLKQDDTPRPQFHHVIDIAPTLYEILDITPPRMVNGVPQDSIDGTSMLYTFDDPEAEGRRTTQFFDIMGSRGIYHDGWFAGTFGPREPWTPGAPPGIMEWNPANDVWELYNLEEDWTQANDLAAEMPEKVNEMKDLFLVESAKNNNLPIGGALWTVLFDPASAPSTPYRNWTFRGRMERMPEFAAPKLGKIDTDVVIEANVPKDANGVLYALGGFSGGLSLFMIDGHLYYEYNLFEVERTRMRSASKIPAGDAVIEVKSRLKEARPISPLDVVVTVNGKEVMSGTVPRTAPLFFTANDCLDIGVDWGSPVSTEYFDKAPFEFEGELGVTTIAYPE